MGMCLQDSRSGHEHIELAKLFLGMINSLIDVSKVANIAGYTDEIFAGG
jgi:hypothetical protein